MTKKTTQTNNTSVQTTGVQWWMTKARGCGPGPVAGGTYASVEPGAWGTPIWEFAVCPTIPVGKMPLSAVAMLLAPRPYKNAKGETIYDVYDYIGEDAYPNPLDWMLEVANLGFHQKMNPEHIIKLTDESMYYAVHKGAGIVNPIPVYEYREEYTHPYQPKCPVPHEAHVKVDLPALKSGVLELGTCVGLFFNDLIDGEKTDDSNNVVVREMPSFSYDGYEALPDIEHEPAIFFQLPIGRMATFLVYEDKQANAHETALAKLAKVEEKLTKVKLVTLE